VSRPGEDAQRELERRALRNVRGLLDRIEDEERMGRRGAMRVAIVAVVVAVVATALVVAWMSARTPVTATNPVVIPPVAKPAGN
jgi:hypothetical protein